MSIIGTLRLFKFPIVNLTSTYSAAPYRGYAVGVSLGKTKKKRGPLAEKIVLPVEKDPHKLVKYLCGSNIYKEGQDIELKPDSEYPDWLWNIRLEPAKLEDLDPNTKLYWRKVRKQNHMKTNRIASTRKF